MSKRWLLKAKNEQYIKPFNKAQWQLQKVGVEEIWKKFKKNSVAKDLRDPEIEVMKKSSGIVFKAI